LAATTRTVQIPVQFKRREGNPSNLQEGLYTNLSLIILENAFKGDNTYQSKPTPPLKDNTMKRVLFALCALSMITATAYGQADLPPKKKPMSDQAKMSYALGMTIGKNVGGEGVELDVPQLLEGLRAALTDKKYAMTDEEHRAAMGLFQKAIVAMQEEKQKEMAAQAKVEAEKNKVAGAKYLAANKEKKGVKVTESGLQYEVLQSGKGASPKKTDTVKAHYHGTFIDGRVFDSSVDRKEPINIPVNRVIPGWTEALQMMKVGDKWRLVIPSDLAYGSEPLPGSPIPPNSVLVFEVELLSIEK